VSFFFGDSCIFVDVMSRPIISIGPGSAIIVGLSLVACTPYADRILAYVSSVGAHRQLLVPPGDKMSNRDLLVMVNKEIDTRLEEMKEFVRREVRAQGTTGIIISNAGTSSPIMIVFKFGLFLGAIYGLLRVSGYPIDDLLFVSKSNFGDMVSPLLEKIDSIGVAAQEGFNVVLDMVKGYRTELKNMQQEVKEKVGQVDSSVSEIQAELTSLSAAVEELDHNMSITNQGMRLICSVVADQLPGTPVRQGLQNLAIDSTGHRPESVNARILAKPVPPSVFTPVASMKSEDDPRKRINDIISSAAKPLLARPRERVGPA